ncbi:MAG: hypothetical protein Fur0028_16290 [Bacteroidales bacterium]
MNKKISEPGFMGLYDYPDSYAKKSYESFNQKIPDTSGVQSLLSW